MKKQLGFALIASFLMLLQPNNAEHLGKNKYGVDIFSVNLDLPEQQRFVEVSTYFKPYLLEVLDQYLNLVPAPLLWFIE